MTDGAAGRQLPLFPGPGARPSGTPRTGPLPPLTRASSLAAAVGAFDDHLVREAKTENTRRAFASDLRLLARHLGSGRAVSDITADDLRGFLTWMVEYRGRPCSPKTYARRVTTLKVFFAWLAESRVLASDVASGIAHRRAEAPLPLVLGDPEVDRLLGAARGGRAGEPYDPRPALVVRLVLETGLKKGELARLRLDDLALDSAPPSLLVRYDHPRWRKKERRITFDPALLPLMADYRARYAPTDRLFPCTARNLEYVLADLVAAAGLPKRTGFEALRWTSALRSWRAGVEAQALRERLGLSPVTWVETERKLALLAGD